MDLAEIVNSLPYETLRAIRASIAKLDDRVDALGAGLRTIKGPMVAFMSNEVVRDASTATLSARIERRLDLRDEA